jgi:branched-chain amino acid transport system substrate-binding protein
MTIDIKRGTRVAAVAGGIALLLLAGACSSSSKKKTPTAANNGTNVKTAAPSLALGDGVPKGTKIGLIISGQGPGNDVQGLAAGAYAAAYRLNGAKPGNGTVQLIVKDDNGDAGTAVAAVDDLASQGVAGIVYGSVGDQMGPAVKEAAAKGLAVIAPYTSDASLTSQGATTFLTGPTDAQQMAKLTSYANGKLKASHIAILHQHGAYGDAGVAALKGAGVTPVADIAFDSNESDLKAEVTKAVNAGADGIVVWAADNANVTKAVTAADLDNAAVQLMVSSRGATPNFGKSQNTMLAPSAQDGLLSAGTWAGAWTPGQDVDNFYAAKGLAVKDGGVSADMSNADIRSHDAVVAIANAAKAASSNQAAPVLAALRQLKISGTGVPLDFSKQIAVADASVAVLAYSTIDDGSGRYPDPSTAGGHWVAVRGTYTLPDALKGLDNANGG